MRWTYGLAGLAVAATAALAQPAPRPAPKPDGPAVLEHIERAKQLAGNDLLKPLSLCNANRTATTAASLDENRKNWLEPTKVFDNLYYIGNVFVGVWIVKTSDGLILFDSLCSADEAREHLVPGLQKLGLDPRQIKYVLVTHGHWDHYGGAQYLRDNFGTRVGLAEADWNLMATMGKGSPELRDLPPPNKDLVITDGMKVTVGDTTITVYVTPGHSPGTISAIVPAREGGRTFPMSLLGGTAFPVTLEPSIHGGGLLLNSQSVERLAKLSREAGAVGIINTHANNDGGLDRIQQLAKRKPGEPHPFVIGAEKVARHYEIFDECLKAAAERLRANAK